MINNKCSVYLSWSEREWKFLAICVEYPKLSGFGLTRALALENLEKKIAMKYPKLSGFICTRLQT